MHFDKFGYMHTPIDSITTIKVLNLYITSKNSSRFFFRFCFVFIFAFVIRTLRWDLSSIKIFWRKQLSWYRPTLFNTPWNSLFSNNCKMRWKAKMFYKIKGKEQVIENIRLAGATFVTLIGVERPRVGLAFALADQTCYFSGQAKHLQGHKSYLSSGVLKWPHLGPTKLFQYLTYFKVPNIIALTVAPM